MTVPYDTRLPPDLAALKVEIEAHARQFGLEQIVARQIDALIEKARLERDTEKRRALVYDIQRSLAKSVFALYPPGSATGFSVAWPCLANFRVYQGGRLNDHLWVDDTKAPFKKA